MKVKINLTVWWVYDLEEELGIIHKMVPSKTMPYQWN